MLLEITTSGIESNPWPIVKLPELGAIAVTIENPASLLTDAPVKDVEPSKEFIIALCDDINTPEAFGQLNILFNHLQNVQDDKKSDLISQIQSSASLLGILKKIPMNG